MKKAGSEVDICPDAGYWLISSFPASFFTVKVSLKGERSPLDISPDPFHVLCEGLTECLFAPPLLGKYHEVN